MWGLSLGCLQPLWSKTELLSSLVLQQWNSHSPSLPHSNPWNHIEQPPPVFIHEDHLNVSWPSPFLSTSLWPLISLGSLEPPSSSPWSPDPGLHLSPFALAPVHALLSSERVVLSLAFSPFHAILHMASYFPKAKVLPCYIFSEWLQWLSMFWRRRIRPSDFPRSPTLQPCHATHSSPKNILSAHTPLTVLFWPVPFRSFLCYHYEHVLFA